MFCSRAAQLSKGVRIGDQVLWSKFGQVPYQASSQEPRQDPSLTHGRPSLARGSGARYL
jgi:hypothetical protein